MPSASEPRLSRCFDALDRDRNFTAENFHTISTDPHIGNMVILPIVLLGGANENAARTVHFQPLLDQNALLASGNGVRHHPSGAASGSGTGGRIFSVVKNHASVQAGFGVDRLATNKVKELSAAGREVLGGALGIKAEILQRVQLSQRGDGEGNAGGDRLDRNGVVEVGRTEAGESRDVVHVVDGAELGILLRHFSKDGLCWFLGKAHGHGTHVQIEPDFGCGGGAADRAGLATQNKRGAERWMSGKGQFFLHGEDAHADPADSFDSNVPGKNEGSFGKIGLARQGLHLFGAETTSIEEDRQRVAGEGAVGKHIDLHHGQAD